MIRELAGKVALISGAAQGIGEATARRMAELGASVVLGDVRTDQVKAVASSIGDAAIAVTLDVSKETDWVEAMRVANVRFGPVTILVNNAGILETPEVVETTDAQFDRMINVNLRGPFLGIRTVGGAMAAKNGGVIVSVGSVVATSPTETLGVYAATKAGVAAMSQVAAMELGKKGVRLVVVRPGSIATPMSGPNPEEFRFHRALALGRIGQAREIADAIAFAASDRASYITGSDIIVDGGWSAGRYSREIEALETVLAKS